MPLGLLLKWLLLCPEEREVIVKLSSFKILTPEPGRRDAFASLEPKPEDVLLIDGGWVKAHTLGSNHGKRMAWRWVLNQGAGPREGFFD